MTQWDTAYIHGDTLYILKGSDIDTFTAPQDYAIWTEDKDTIPLSYVPDSPIEIEVVGQMIAIGVVIVMFLAIVLAITSWRKT